MADTATNKTLFTRISLKYDTYTNWTTNNPVLLKGEAAIATIDSGNTQEVNSVTTPQVLVKIGDGTSNYNALPFISARAADVYSWAKAATKPEYKAEEIQELEDFVNDLNTTYTFTEDNGKLVITPSEGEAVTIDFTDNFAAKTHGHTISDVEGLQDELDSKVDSITAGDTSITIGGTDADPTVAVKLSAAAGNAIELADDGLKVIIPDAAEYSISKAADSGEFAAVYNLTKDGVAVGASINIPKDMVVKNGTVVTDPEGQAAGTYIMLEFQNVEEPVYINVGNLIEYVTSGSQTGDMVVVNVSDDHKVTATITDGTVTLAKLDAAVQTEINKAHTHENADVLAGITADKVAAWDAAEENANDYTDAAIEDLDSSVAATAEADNKISVLTGVTQENGKLTGKTEATLAAIAKTGSTDDLVQGSLTLVFDCGSSEI